MFLKEDLIYPQLIVSLLLNSQSSCLLLPKETGITGINNHDWLISLTSELRTDSSRTTTRAQKEKQKKKHLGVDNLLTYFGQHVLKGISRTQGVESISKHLFTISKAPKTNQSNKYIQSYYENPMVLLDLLVIGS